MQISIDISGNAEEVLGEYAAKLKDKLESAVAKGGKLVEGEAKALCPVSTEATRPGGPHGELRQSITSQAEGTSAEVTAAKEYAAYVEFGTCKMAAQPYLVPALKNKEGEVVELIADAIRK